MQRCNCTGNPASIAWAVPRGTLAVAGCASAVNVGSSVSRLHPAPATARRCILLQESERECIGSITSRRARTSSRVDGSRFRLALSNDPPLSCHSAPLSDPLSLPLFPAVILCPFLAHPATLPRPPPSSTIAPVQAASGVTLNSGPAVIVTWMCPTTKS